MTAIGWLQILVFFAAIVAVTKPLGVYMFRVFEGERAAAPARARPARAPALSAVAASIPQQRADLAGSTPSRCWRSAPSACSSPTCIQRLQHVLPFNPQHLGAVEPTLGVQHRRQLHHQHQLAGLLGRIDDELPHADGGARLAQLHLGGGRHRRGARAGARLHAPAAARTAPKTLGNFWVDLIRGIVYVLPAAQHRLRRSSWSRRA